MNKVILMGRLTKDVERKESKTKKAVCTFDIAVTRKFDKEKTDFINCIAWEKNAEFITKYCVKGQKIVIIGELNVDNFQNDKKENVKLTRVNVDEIYFASDKKETKKEENTNEVFE